jgi:pilus assembly protein FimV
VLSNVSDLLREKGTMLRKIVVTLTMLLCSMATQVYALGLGTVTVESSLNQPLRMRIELLQLGDARLQDIRVSVASGADFARFNIERDDFLSNIRFSVESAGQDNVVILTSSQIVREPYLSFILDTRWPNGRLLSEHTILLDLPVFDDQQSSAEIRQPISPILRPPISAQAADVEPATAPVVAAPISTNSAISPQPEIISAQPQAEPEAIEATAEPEDPEPEVVEQETIVTDSNDTLSDIAQQVRPNTVVSMQQTMLALLGLNRNAFADGNINKLRSGEVLRVPTLAEIQSIDPRDAVDEVRRQNQDFADADVQPLAAPSDAMPDQDDQPQGQLSVLSVDDARSGAAGLGDAENEGLDQRIAELEAQLAQRQEEADRARVEREELDSRMADLEVQIAAAQEIIRLQDIQLAQLQESLNAVAADAQLIAEQQAIQDAAAAEAALLIDPPSSLADDVTVNSIFILFGIILVILVLVVLMQRRNRAAKVDDNNIDEMAEQNFDVGTENADTESSETDEAVTELRDYDSSDLEGELDDVITVFDEMEEARQREEAAAEEEKGVNHEPKPKPFLDGLGIDLDSFDYDDNVNEPEVGQAKDGPVGTEKTKEVPAESQKVDLMFDLGDDDASENSAIEFEANEGAVEKTEIFEFDLDNDSSAIKSEVKDPKDLDTVESDADAVTQVTADTDAAASITEVTDATDDSVVDKEDLNVVEFPFDEEKIDGGAEAPAPASNEEVDTFDFDLDLDLDGTAGDTALEKPDADVTSVIADDVKDFDFDLDEIDIESVKEEAATSQADADDDDLGFLSDDDVEVEAFDDVEEASMLSVDDETATKLELAYAYQKMGDMEGAKEILQEVIKEGSDEQAEEASKLLGSLVRESD